MIHSMIYWSNKKSGFSDCIHRSAPPTSNGGLPVYPVSVLIRVSALFLSLSLCLYIRVLLRNYQFLCFLFRFAGLDFTSHVKD